MKVFVWQILRLWSTPWNVYLLKCWNMLCHCQLKTIIVNYLPIKMFLLIKRLQFFLHLWNKKVNKFLPMSNGNLKQLKKCFKIAFLRLTNGNWVELPSLLNCNLSEMQKKKKKTTNSAKPKNGCIAAKSVTNAHKDIHPSISSLSFCIFILFSFQWKCI